MQELQGRETSGRSVEGTGKKARPSCAESTPEAPCCWNLRVFWYQLGGSYNHMWLVGKMKTDSRHQRVTHLWVGHLVHHTNGQKSGMLV